MKESSTTLRLYLAMVAAFACWNLWRAAQPPISGFLVAAAFYAYAVLDFRRLVVRAPYVLGAAFLLPVFPISRAFLDSLPQGLSAVSCALVAIPVGVAAYLIWQVRLVARELKAA